MFQTKKPPEESGPKKKPGALKKLGKIRFEIGFSFFFRWRTDVLKMVKLAVQKILKNRMAGCDPGLLIVYISHFRRDLWIYRHMYKILIFIIDTIYIDR